MPEHVHVHLPHELQEGNGSVSRLERRLEIVAALLLAVSTLLIAWSGYQAARWSGLQARHYAEASTARALANRAEADADEARLQDILNFNGWLEAEHRGDADVQAFYERRFRDEFLRAFDAWQAQGDPIADGDAIASPLLMSEYVLDEEQESDRLEEVGDRRFEQGREATETGDSYVFATVFFAIVLFFSGVSLRFEWTRLRVIMLVLSAAFLVWGLARILDLPTA